MDFIILKLKTQARVFAFIDTGLQFGYNLSVVMHKVYMQNEFRRVSDV